MTAGDVAATSCEAGGIRDERRAPLFRPTVLTLLAACRGSRPYFRSAPRSGDGMTVWGVSRVFSLRFFVMRVMQAQATAVGLDIPTIVALCPCTCHFAIT